MATILPLPQRLATTSLLSVSMDSLFWTLHRDGIMQCVIFCVCLLSCSLMFSRCVRVVADVSASFLFMAESCSPACMKEFGLCLRAAGTHTGSLAGGSCSSKSPFCSPVLDRASFPGFSEASFQLCVWGPRRGAVPAATPDPHTSLTLSPREPS